MKGTETTFITVEGGTMKKVILNIILSFNALVWIILSAVNYIGIMLQLNEDIMSIFLWSIFTIMMYGLVLYSITMVLSRVYMIYQFRANKVKYLNRQVFLRQLLLLAFVITYLYGACYYNAHLLGLLPLLLFFGKKLTQLGSFYVVAGEKLMLIDDIAKEYFVRDINLPVGKIEIQENNTRNLEIKVIEYKMRPEEKKFLAVVFAKEEDVMEVA
jgi:hypothetical protein